MMMSDCIAADRNESSRLERPLTVVIPHFNQKDFLPRAVASVLNGETREIEIIIVDDGSTDDSEPTLALSAAMHPFITVIRGKVNRGAPAALNTARPAALIVYVSFLIADDLVLLRLYKPFPR